MARGPLVFAALLFGLALGAGETEADPFARSARIRVLLFVRTDCPVTNRYAPELARIAGEFRPRGVQFWLVYSDPGETLASMREHAARFHLPGNLVRDADHRLAARAQATVTPQAAVFDHSGALVYSGRIDDRFVDFGKSQPAVQVHDLEDALRSTLAGKPVAHPRTRAVGCFLADLR